MLIRKLERARADKFIGALRHPDSDMADESDEERLSAFLSERVGGGHRGRPTDPDAVVHNLVVNGFTPDAWLPATPAVAQGDGPLPEAPSESLASL